MVLFRPTKTQKVKDVSIIILFPAYVTIETITRSVTSHRVGKNMQIQLCKVMQNVFITHSSRYIVYTIPIVFYKDMCCKKRMLYQ